MKIYASQKYVNDVKEELEQKLGSPSWNDLTDKPFGETASVSDTLTYDGTPTDTKITPSLMEGVEVYWVNESTPTIEQFKSGTATVYQGEFVEMNLDSVTQAATDNLYMVPGLCFVVNVDDYTTPEEVTGTSIYFPKKGIYITVENGVSYVPTITIPDFEFVTGVAIKPLDSKYLPLPAAAIDLSGFETEGKIVETMPDGTIKTTLVEFDADGNITKITDADGNETVLTW